MPRWWLSFADPEGVPGKQLLGACIIEAIDVTAALVEAWRMGINPGGEVQAMQIDEDRAEMLADEIDLAEYSDRLLRPEEAKGLALAIDRKLGS